MASLLLWAAAVHAQQDEAPPLLESKSSVLPPSGPFMFENADYTYHQGTFDVHFNDTVRPRALGQCNVHSVSGLRASSHVCACQDCSTEYAQLALWRGGRWARTIQ